MHSNVCRRLTSAALTVAATAAFGVGATSEAWGTSAWDRSGITGYQLCKHTSAWDRLSSDTSAWDTVCTDTSAWDRVSTDSTAWD